MEIFWNLDTRRWRRGDWILFWLCETLMVAFGLTCFTVDDISATLGPLEWQAVVLGIFWIIGTMFCTIRRRYNEWP